MKRNEHQGLPLFYRLLITFLAVVIVIGGILTLVYYVFSKASLEKHTRDDISQQFEAIGYHFRYELADDLVRNLQVLNSNPTLDEFMMSSDLDRDINARKVERLFIQTLHYMKSFQSISFVDYLGKEKIRVTRAGRVKTYRDRTGSALFTRIESGKPGEIYIDGPLKTEDGRILFSIGIYKTDGDIGKFGGAVIIEYGLDDFLGELDKVKILGENLVWAFTKDGHVLKRPQNEESVFDPRAYLPKGIQKNPALTAVNGGMLMFQDLSISPGRPLIRVVVTVPSSLLLKDIRPVLKFLLMVFLISIFIIFLISYYFSGYLSKPIIELAHAATRLAKGDLSTRVKAKVKTTGEVQMLVDSFNEMAHDLEKTTVSKEYVDKIFKSMIDTLIVASPDGTIRTVNDAARTLLGYRSEELTGQPIKRIFPEDGDRVFDEFVRYGLMKNTEYTYVTKDNRKIPVLLSSSVIYSSDATAQGIVCVAVDITERKNAENNILRSRQTMQAILGSMPYGVVIIGKDKKIRSANEAALKLMNYDAEKQIVGMTCNHTLCPAQEGKCPIIDLNEKLDRSEKILITKDGKRVPILKTVVPVEIDGEDVLLEAFVDMTERKKAEEQLKKYSEELEQINEEMKNFAYIVSHDLRAPLVNIKGFSDELGRSIQEFAPLLEKRLARGDAEEIRRTEELVKKDIPEALGFIGSSVTRMDALINSILKLSRLGRNELKPELVRTEDIVQILLKSLAHQIDMHKAEVTIGPLPDLIMDRTAAEQIFGNLLDNALKYLDPSRPGKIEITAEQNAGETIFTVRDNGRGIAKEDTQKVFELFRRVGKQDVPGEGMGLTYVKTLVRRLGGRIWCESEPGVWTAFRFAIHNKAHTENRI